MHWSYVLFSSGAKLEFVTRLQRPNVMEPPEKRRRLSSSPEVESPYDRARREVARKDLRSKLKSRFESIFEKYGKDFSGVGDEIDLTTGIIVVDNGHLLGMKNETDPDTTAKASGSMTTREAGDDDDDDDEDRECILDENVKIDYALGDDRAQPPNDTPPEFAIDPRWEYPELPGDPINPELELEEEDLSDEISERAESPKRSIWDLEQPECIRPHKKEKPRWTEDEDSLLLHLRTNMPGLSYGEIIPEFPGRTIPKLYARWNSLRRKLRITDAESEDPNELGLRRKRQSWSHIQDKEERLRAINKASAIRYSRSQAISMSLHIDDSRGKTKGLASHGSRPT